MNNDMLSQEEIDALLKGNLGDIGNTSESDSQDALNDVEKDALGEIGNISMGTAATTLYTLLNQPVKITTPKVKITTMEELSSEYQIPFVAVQVKYKLGLRGTNLLILKTDDVKVIADLMMGGDGTNIDRDLNEMDLSAISEAMNQMVGSSCTSLSEMFSYTIDIEPPEAFEIDFSSEDIPLLFDKNEEIVKVSFRMIIGDLIDSEIMQLIPLEFAQDMVKKLMGDSSDNSQPIQPKEMENEAKISEETISKEIATSNKDNFETKEKNIEKPQYDKKKEEKAVNIQKAQFRSFDNEEKIEYNESINLIQEIPVEITVELGRTTRKIQEILEYGPGTIIELDKLVGEPLEIFANGKFIAKGEVVVIDDNFGVRITDIISPSKRIKK
ncbi:flagellar motor switch phosphatase FliY [Thermohalobacter berrensis]|uniref:Flagellar motor switch phosphatase FliY n=1 Tax=Thermohalobacter berrensis TaxID=99594 RepID=A0A419TAF0_9FIRM|nr:flagellar motor switch phosphatase FliY [Thermohalobacter berrensis]RKD34445.1 flagellar motor switch phosphatase FliY [Thermohalobacter berrensis]